MAFPVENGIKTFTLTDRCSPVRTAQSQESSLAFQNKHIISYETAVISCGRTSDPLAAETDGMRFVFMHELGCCENINHWLWTQSFGT